MIELISPLLVKWIYLHMIIIVAFLLYILYSQKRRIACDIKNNKTVYLILLILFLIGFVIRFVNIIHWQHIVQDSQEYIVQSAMIADSGKFSYIHDSPVFSIILSLLIDISGYNPSIGSVINVTFGSLTIILIFIFMKLFFRNNKTALIAAIILTFSSLHYDASLTGAPKALSIFFMLLAMVLLEIIIIIKRYMQLYPLGVVLGFASQIYYIELILVLPAVVYILMQLGLTKKTFYFLGTFLLIILISILPF